MVARNTDAEVQRNHSPRGALEHFLIWWQGMLSALVSGSQATAGSVMTRVAEETPGRHRKVFAVRSPAVAWIGGLAILAGAVGTVVLSADDALRPVALAGAGMSLVWGALRWALLRAGATDGLRKDPHAIRGAWALGSIAWILGVTPELRAMAWAVSGAVTWLVLERLGVKRRQVAVCVGLAWGAQALVVVGSWLARNVVIGVLATRG